MQQEQTLNMNAPCVFSHHCFHEIKVIHNKGSV